MITLHDFLKIVPNAVTVNVAIYLVEWDDWINDWKKTKLNNRYNEPRLPSEFFDYEVLKYVGSNVNPDAFFNALCDGDNYIVLKKP